MPPGRCPRHRSRRRPSGRPGRGHGVTGAAGPSSPCSTRRRRHSDGADDARAPPGRRPGRDRDGTPGPRPGAAIRARLRPARLPVAGGPGRHGIRDGPDRLDADPDGISLIPWFAALHVRIGADAEPGTMIGTTTRSPRWLRMLAVAGPTSGRTTMEAASAWGAVLAKGDAGRFTGDVWLRSGPSSADGTNVGIVHFSPGARTRWHAHPGGQFLYGLTGRGRVLSRGGPGHVLEPGDIVHVPTGEWHFHGGAPDSPVVHVAVNGGGAPEWGDPVSDQDYGEGF